MKCSGYLAGQLNKTYSISPQGKACIKGFTIFSVISYLYYVTNNLNNYDSIAVLAHGYGMGIDLGRWFLQILGDWVQKHNMDYNIPFFNTLIGLVFLGVSAYLVIRILHIEDTALCFAIGSITAAFPSIAATLFFPYTVHFYFFAIFLSTLGCYLAIQQRLYRVLSVAFFALSLGIFQAYYPFIGVILVLSLIQQTMDDNTHWRDVLKQSIICLALLILGYIVYMLLTQYFLGVYHWTLSDYKGVSTMGTIELRTLPRQIYQVYKSFFELPIHDFYSVSTTGVVRLCILLEFALVILSVIFGWKKRDLLKNIELCVLILLLPLAANSIMIMVPAGGIYTIMVFGCIGLFYLPCLLTQHLPTSGNIKKLLILVTVAATLLASVDYSYQSNGNYRALYYQNRKVENYYSVLLSRIKSAEGYKEDMEIVFVGDKIDDTSFYDRWHKYIFQYGGKNISASYAINDYSRPDFIESYFGYVVRDATEDELEKYSDLFAEMSTYPDDGSIQVIDHAVYINCQ